LGKRLWAFVFFLSRCFGRAASLGQGGGKFIWAFSGLVFNFRRRALSNNNGAFGASFLIYLTPPAAIVSFLWRYPHLRTLMGNKSHRLNNHYWGLTAVFYAFGYGIQRVAKEDPAQFTTNISRGDLLQRLVSDLESD